MADTLRELVVSLSLESSNFSRNMRTITNQIKEIESEFRAASAGTSIFQSSVERLNAQLDMESRKLTEQERAVTQYGRALEAAKQKLEQDAEYLAKYSQRHTELEEKMKTEIDTWGDLSICVDKHREAYEALKAAYGEDDSRTQQAKAELEYYEQFNDALKLTEGQVASLKKELQNDEDAVSKFSAGLNNAKAEVKDTEKRIADLNKQISEEEKALQIASSRWTFFATTMSMASSQLKTVSQVAQTAGRALSRYVTAPIVGLGTAAIKASLDFESSFANVRKTVDATDERFEELMDSSKKMSTELATGTTEINTVMATAGQLGVPTDDIEEFTEIMLKLGVACEDLDADTAATTIAKFINVMGTSYDDVDKLGATLVDLGNNFATTEGPIMEMAQRMSGAGKIVGLTEAQVLGFAAALSSVGIEAQMGGSSFSKALVKMEVAAVEGGEDLEQFAAISGMTAKEFQQVWASDPAAAFQAFIVGLAQLDDEGISAIGVLNEIGISEIRLRDTLLRTVNASELMTRAQVMANEAWNNGTALNTEFDKRMQTTEAQLANLKNSAMLFAQTLGDDLNPTIRDIITRAGELVDKLMDMDSAQRLQIIKFGAIAAAAGPVLLIFSKVAKGLSTVTAGLSTFATAVAKAGGGVQGLGSVLASAPGLWLALAAAVVYATYKFFDWVTGAKAARDALEKLDGTVREWEQDATTAFEKVQGLAAFNIDSEAFGLDSFSKDANEWLTNLIDVWTDGKKETDEIVNEMVKSWTDGSDKIRQAEGITDEDVKALDDIDKEIESILRKRQNGYLTDKDKERLDELIGAREEIAIEYKLVPDVESGFDDIVTKAEAALSRNAKAEDVFTNAFAAAHEGLGIYLDELNKKYDDEYARIQQITDEKERQNELDKLDNWYNTEKQKGLSEYAQTLIQVGDDTEAFAAGSKYDNQIKKLEKLRELMDAAVGGNNEADAAIYNFLQGWDEADLIETKAAIDAYKEAYEGAGLEVPDWITEAETAFTNVDNLLSGKTYDVFSPETQEVLDKMFGGVDEEVNEVYAHFNLDSLDESWNTWAGQAHSIDADVDASKGTVTAPPPLTMTVSRITDEGLTREDVEITSIDNMAGTVTYIEDGVEKVATFEELKDMDATVKYLDADGNMVYTSPFKAALAGMQGRIANVTVDGNTIIPTVEVDAHVNNLSFDEDGYTNDADPAKGKEAAKEKLGKNGVVEAAIDAALEWLGSSASVRDIGMDSSIWSMLEKASTTPTMLNSAMVQLDENDGKGWTQLAQYIADGYQLIKDNQMTEDERAQFEADVELIKTLIGMDTAGGWSFGKYLAEAMNDFAPQWNVDADNITDVLDKVGLSLLGRRGGGGGSRGGGGGRFTGVGDDIGAAIGEGMEDHDYGTSASSTMETIEDELRDAADSHSPAKKFIPVGEDIAAGVGEGIEEYNASEPAQRLANNVRAALSGSIVSSQFISIGRRATEGIVQGIRQGQASVINAIIETAKKAVDAAKKELGIASPSKVFKEEIGENLMKGIGEGVMSEVNKQGKVIANASRYLTSAAATASDPGHSSIASNDVTNNNVSSSVVNHFNINASVRSDNDIRKLAQQIARLTARVNGGYGMLSQLKKA